MAFFVNDFALSTNSPAGIPRASSAQFAICDLVDKACLSVPAMVIANMIAFTSLSSEKISSRFLSVIPYALSTCFANI